MNQYYSLKFGLEASSVQPEVVQLIKSVGEDVIQTSDGLCLKTTRSEDDVRAALKGAGYAAGITVEKMDEEALKAASPNVRSFAGLN